MHCNCYIFNFFALIFCIGLVRNDGQKLTYKLLTNSLADFVVTCKVYLKN